MGDPVTSVSFRELVSNWVSLAGPLVSAVTRPALLTQAGVLVVECGTPFWLDRLEERAPEMLRTLPLVDGHRLTGIRFVYVQHRSK